MEQGSTTPAPSARSGQAARSVSARLPSFPWDRLLSVKEEATRHPGGLVDLSVGTPVDPTPESVQQALRDTADSPGYPTVWGTPALRRAMSEYLERRCAALPLSEESVLPTIGSKELVASLPTQLGLGAGDTVVIPQVAYPTYAVGAILAGAEYVATDATVALGPRRVALVWLNSPSNPTGRVLPVDHVSKVVAWARERGAVVASDECYFECSWEGEPPVSVLDPRVNGGSLDGLLAVHSLSKRSDMAGYRAAFVAGDHALVGELREVRRHSGLMVSRPVQAAMTAALRDDGHAEQQRTRYLRRRAMLVPALADAGLRIDHSEASLYLWATRNEPCMETVAWFAARGILVAPGDFYGQAGGRHVRISLTATDERVAAAVSRL